MSNTAQPANATLVAEDETQLLAVVRQNGLQVETAQSLQASFAPLFGQARILIEKSRSIVVTDASQTVEIKTARIHRLALKVLRVSGEKLRKEIKEESLRRSKAIDGFANSLDHVIVTEEKRLEEQEQFVEVQEAKRQAALKESRTLVLSGLNIEPSLYQLGQMSEETFQQLVEGTKLARAAQEAARVKAEADRIAKDAADLAERERIRLENERLKKEADEKETALKVERERVEQERLAAEQVAKAERERLEAIAAEDRRVAAEAAEQARKEREAIEARAAEEKRQADAALAAAAVAAKAELDRREALAAEERRKHEEAAAEIRRVAKENAEKAEAVLAEQKRKADETAAALKKEADEKARKAKVEADKRAAALKEENDRIQAQLKAEQDAQAKRAADAAEAASKAARAPDKDKIVQLAKSLDVHIPEMATAEGKAVVEAFMVKQAALIGWLREEYKKL